MVRLRSACMLRASMALAVATLVGASLRPIEAQDLSSQPIRFIVAGPAAGAADVMARLVAIRISESLHANVDVENRPGDDFVPVLHEFATAPADGHTLLFLSTSTLIAQLLHPDPFNVAALTPVTEVAAGPLILTARKSFPVSTLGNLIAYAKADPHRLVIAAGGGAESAATLAAEVLMAKAGIDVALVAYQGGPAIDKLLAGHIDVVLDDMTVIGSRVGTGILHPLVVTGAVRSPVLPDVPTVMEAGLSDYAFEHWFGILAPANTPPAIARLLRDEVARALAASDVVDELDRQGLRPVASEPDQWRAYLENELEHYAKVIEQAGIKPK